MKEILNLQQHLQASLKFEERYALEPDGKIHLLYVSPRLNSSGYYRMLAPALELNNSHTHQAIVTHIESHDFSSTFTEQQYHLDTRLIAWADYIIFPALFNPMNYLIPAILALNPSVKLVMDLERNYFALPLSKKFTRTHQKHLEKHLEQMDMVTVAHRGFQKFLERLMRKRLHNADTLIQYVPSLVSRMAYQDLPSCTRSSKTPLRIGLLKPTEGALLSLKVVLLAIHKHFEEDIQFVGLGMPQSVWKNDKDLQEVPIETHTSVSFATYFRTLQGLDLDVVLLPAQDNLYNKQFHQHVFLELSVFGIPVIASPFHSATAHIKNGEMGFIAHETSDWIAALQRLNRDAAFKSRLSRNLIANLWKTLSYTQPNIKRFTDVFI